jgi:hypothetical protein
MPIHRIQHVTALVTLTGIVFFLFFQLNKGGSFREINPFGVDPYDAVGSFAIQVTLLVGFLTYARALRLITNPPQATKTRLILRGNILVLIAIWTTLIADYIAEIIHPFSPSFWGSVLLVELALMCLFALICVIELVIAFRGIQTPAPPNNLTPANGIDDLLTLVRFPVTKASRFLPRAFVDWVQRTNSDCLFARSQWLNPRTNPWRFACGLGLLVGSGLLLAQLQEGLPPSLEIGLLVAGIFISAELRATLIGFAIIGGYLGLRPSFKNSTR